MHHFLQSAKESARIAGALLKTHFGQAPDVNAFEAHDIKLELDVRSQELITAVLLKAHPGHAVYGEEGIAGDQSSPFQWIVDPIDGTVNYFYGIPHFCISIALRREGRVILGVIYDPMRDELWEATAPTATAPATALLNGKPVRVSARRNLGDAVLSVGFAKTQASIDAGLPLFEKMVVRARKCRLMGSAALDLAFVAAGRLDAYIESSVNLWDIAAGQLLLENAGGRCELSPHPEIKDKFAIKASNGVLDLNVI